MTNFFGTKVKCDECKHWVDKEDAQKVDFTSAICVLWYISGFSYFYCPLHKKPYHSIYRDLIGRFQYHGEVLMESDGTPVGYEKIKEKKHDK